MPSLSLPSACSNRVGPRRQHLICQRKTPGAIRLRSMAAVCDVLVKRTVAQLFHLRLPRLRKPPRKSLCGSGHFRPPALGQLTLGIPRRRTRLSVSPNRQQHLTRRSSPLGAYSVEQHSSPDPRVPIPQLKMPDPARFAPDRQNDPRPPPDPIAAARDALY